MKKGTLKAGSANALSSRSETTVEGGATLDLGGKTQTINKLTVNGWKSKVENGTLVNRDLTNEGQISLTGLSQSQGSIINPGEINLGSGSLQATRVTNSGTLDVKGSAEVESLVTSGNATFVDLTVDQTVSNHSIENSANLTISGSLETDDSVLTRGSSTTTITGVAGQTSAQVRGLLVGQESNQSGRSSFTLRKGNLDSDFIRIGSEKSSSPSSVTLNNGDVFSHSITIQSGSSLDVEGTIDLFEQDNANGGSLELHGTAKAEVLQGSDGDDQVNLDAGSDLTLSGSTSTNLGQCRGGGCDAAINLGSGNDLLVTNQAKVSISSGSVIDGGDLGTIINGEWVGEINVYENESPDQSPGFERSALRNFALINYDGDWETPQGLKACNFDGDGNFLVAEDRTCLLLEAESPRGNTLSIDNGATLRAGVISFDVDGDTPSALDNVIRLENGNLSAVVVEGRSDVDDDFLLGSDQGESGALSVQLLSGFDRLKQQGGTWTYDIKGYDFGDDPLELQVQSGDVMIDSTADASGAATGEATFSSIAILGGQETQITNKGELAVTGERGSGITGNAALLTTSGSTTWLGGSSNYTGDTVVEDGASLIALNEFALSDDSSHTIRGFLDLGEGGGRQLVKKLNLEDGVISEGILSTKEGVDSSVGLIFASLTGASPSAGLTTSGGMTTLSGANTYTGATSINEGTLQVTGTLSDSTAVSVAKGATYDVDATDSIGSIAGAGFIELSDGVVLRAGGDDSSTEVSGVISGAGSFTKAGTGTTIFSGNNTYEGATNINGGTLEVTGSLSDSTAVTVAEDATYDVASTDTIGSIAGAGSIQLTSGKTLTAGGNNNSTTVSGVISGAGSFTKAGTGTTIFSGNNTYEGATNINGGTLEVTGSLSDSTAVTVAEDATYDVASTDTIGSIAGAGSIQLTSGKTLTAGGNNNSTTVSGVISGAGSFTKAGTGTTIFSGNNTYEGATNINGGTLEVTGSLSDSTAVTVAEDATYDVASTDTIGSIAGAGFIELSDGVVLRAGGDDSSTEVSGVISGTASFVKEGSGTTTFSGNNTYTGTTTINAGILQVGRANALSAFSDTTVESGGTLDLGKESHTIHTLTTDAGATVQEGTLVSRNLTNEGQINLTGLSQSEGSIENSGEINLGSGGLQATRLTNSGSLNISGNAIFEDLSVKTASRSNQSIESSGELTITGSLETSAPMLMRGNSITTITGVVGQTSAQVRGLLVGQESNQSGSSRFTIENGSLDADFIRIGSEKSTSPSSVALNNGDVFSHSIAIQLGSSLDVGGTVDLFDRDHADGGSLELQGTAKAKVLQGSDGDDQLTLDAGADLTLSGSMTTKLGECSDDGCQAAINLGLGDDLFVTNQATVEIPAGSVIDGGDIGSFNGREWVGEMNVYQNLMPDQLPGFERSALKNFALIKYNDDWETSEELEGCNFDRDGNYSVSADKTCLLLESAGLQSNNLQGNTLSISEGTFRAGVISFNSIAPVADGNNELANLLAEENIVSLQNGNLAAVVLEGSQSLDDHLVLGTSVLDSGSFAVQSLTRFNSLTQQAGTWTYDIKGYGFENIPQELQVQSGDVIIDSSAARSEAGTGEATFSSITIMGTKGAKETQITNKGELAVTGERGSGITGNAALRTTSGSTTRLGGSSNYTGETVIEDGASLIAMNHSALSEASSHTIRGFFELGDGDWHQQVKALNLDGGVISEGILSTEGGLFSSGGEIFASLTGSGGLVAEEGITTLYSTGSDYFGATTVEEGATLRGVLNEGSEHTIVGTLDLGGERQHVNTLILEGGSIETGSLSTGEDLQSRGGSIRTKLTGDGGLVAKAGTTTLHGTDSDYSGPTNVMEDAVLRAGAEGALSASSEHTIVGTLDLGGERQHVNSLILEGGSIETGSLSTGKDLQSRGGSIRTKLTGDGGLVAKAGTTTLHGTDSDYSGPTNVMEDAVLRAGAEGALSASSEHTIVGTLDLGGERQHVNSLILEGGSIETGSLSTGKDLQSRGGSIRTKLTGDGGLVAKAGTTTLYGTGSDYSGATTVEEGATLRGVLNEVSEHTIVGTLDLGGERQHVNKLMLEGGSIETGSLSTGEDLQSRGGSINVKVTGAGGLIVEEGETTMSGSSSDYSGNTVVQKEARLAVLKENALSNQSMHIVRGALELGDSSQSVKSLRLEDGVISQGTLATEDDVFASGGVIDASLTGKGGLVIAEKTALTLNKPNDYSGRTTIQQGATLKAGVDGALSSQSDTTSISQDGALDLNGTNQFLRLIRLNGGLIEGNDGVLSAEKIISKGGSVKDLGKGPGEDSVNGSIGEFSVQSGVTVFAGRNFFEGALDVVGGEVRANNDFSFSQNIKTTASRDGVLNFLGFEQRIVDVEVFEAGRMYVEQEKPFEADYIRLRADVINSGSPGGIVVNLQDKAKNAPIKVNEKFIFESGSLVVTAPSAEEPEGEWKIIDGVVDSANQLAQNTYLVIAGVGRAGFGFKGLGEDNAVMGPALYKGYLTEGSLNLMIEPKTQEELFCGLHPGDPDCDGLDLNYPSPELESSSLLPIVPCSDDEFCLIGTEQPEGSFCPEGQSFVDGECSKPGNDEPNLIGNELPDLIGNELPDLIGIDLPNVGELPDTDGDGLPDLIDPKPDKPCEGDDCLVGNELPDTDGDGLPDLIDPKPDKPCEGDDCLVGNELPDTDGDGLPDLIDPKPDKPCEGDDCLVGNELPDTDGDGLPDLIDPKPDKPCEGDDCLVGNELPDTDDDGLPDILDPDDDNDGIPDKTDPDADGDGELDQLPGCEVGDDLCDVISDIPGDEDEAWDAEEEAATEIIDALLDGLQGEQIDLLLGFDYGELSRLVASGLAPRNVDAAGRGLALHNNLLVDAVFDRQPLRQFEESLVRESLVQEEPVFEEEAAVVDLDGVSLVDQQDDELNLSKHDGVSAWVRGFGGNSRADDSSSLYNDYDLSAYGTSFGVDVALSESFQIGAYANYGDLNVQHRSGDTGGGSWSPEGWGGGITAEYSTRHFYVQGLLGASEFTGEQSRNIVQINNDLGGNTARGDKSVTSYLGALRIGAPFKTGGVLLEPQGQVVWTRNYEQRFSESHGSDKNLRLKYKSRTTNFAETELGMKLSVPIRIGERGLLVPSVRAAWLSDWNMANEGQEIGYKFSKKMATFDSQLGTENGALMEAGLDYTIQSFDSTFVKLYGRGGVELWDSERGTVWRASAGVIFQF
ncbi:hypothetical protein KR49_07725 [Synechococcus sp. KORDI-49]|nr:hypothetical protein KR49_07725 [Synechococcus sp. KORDI-49]